jgi:hypothetical protein
VKLAIVALDAQSLRHAAAVATAAAIELVGVIAEGWTPLDGQLPAALITDSAAQLDRLDCSLYVAGDASMLNSQRLAVMLRYKLAGFRFATLVAPDAEVNAGVRLRENTLIGFRARLSGGVDVGANVLIGDLAAIGQGARIGQSVWIGRDCVIGDGCRIGKNCILGDEVCLAAGCVLEPWSVLAAGYRLGNSPARTMFIDGLFRAPVEVYGRATLEGSKS